MKVMFCSSDNYKSSGAFLSMAYLCYYLKNKFKVDVLVVLPRKGDGIDILNELNIPYRYVRSYNWVRPINEKISIIHHIMYYFKKLYNKLSVYRLRKIIKHDNIDLIHQNTTWNNVGIMAGIKERKITVCHLREAMELYQGKTVYPNWNYACSYFNKCDVSIAISHHIEKYYKQFINNTVMIYNGVDIDKFYNKEKEIFNSDLIKVKIIGNICEGKGQYKLIEAIKRMPKEYYEKLDVEIIGVGEYDYVEKLKKIVERYSLTSKIYFTGACNEMVKKYAESDVICVCCDAEAFGRVAVEAMLGGTLVIGPDSGGTAELLKNRNTGLLYEHDSIDSLCQNICYAMNNKDEMKIIANNARAEAKNKFSGFQNASNIYSLYNSLLLS